MKTLRWRKILLAVLLVIPAGLCVYATLFVYFSGGPSPECLFPTSGPAHLGTSARRLVSGGRQRCYLLYAPAGYDPARPAPVVIMLHGFASNGHGIRAITGWDLVAERENFLVLYPDGSAFPARWNIGPIANIPDIDDVQFLRDMIADVQKIAVVDPVRLYVVGFSNGGQMTHRIACRLAGQVAAVGVVDGIDLDMLKSCSPARPVPVMAFFGTAGPIQNREYPKWFLKLVNVGTKELNSMSYTDAETWAESWARRNACAMPYQALPTAGSAHGIRYQGCAGDAEVVLYIIKGQGHTWPGGGPLPFMGDDVSDINASQELWAFFQRHPLTQPADTD